jgi:16S rRNA C967 or C1407 C5-methylase (RsmB/RsmF family)
LKGLDATSAPGNKTLQFSQLVGEVLSFEKDEQRFGILKKRVHEYRARNVIAINDDFLDTKPEENPNL